MQPLDAGVRDQQELAGLHPRLAVARDHVGLNDQRHTGFERLRRNRPGGAALAAEDRREKSPPLALQENVDDGETPNFDHRLSPHYLARPFARLWDLRDR